MTEDEDDGDEERGDELETRMVELSAEMELRFEVESGEVKVVVGMFGTELASDREYLFGPLFKGAIYTWKGCRLRLKGESSVEYTSEETPMHSYLNAHIFLAQEREAKGQGPRVCLVGPADSGKTSLAKLILAYSIRIAPRPELGVPLLASLDPSAPAYAPPTTLSLSRGSGLASLEDVLGFGMTHVTGPSPYQTASTLAWHYGSTRLADNTGRWRQVVELMGKAWHDRCARDDEAKKAGLVIDMPGMVDKAGQDLIKHVIQAFDVNVVLVMGHERLHSDLTRALSKRKKPAPVLIKLNTSGGVVQRDAPYHKSLLVQLVKRYFHGSPSAPLHPFVTTVKFDELTIWRFESSGSNVTATSTLEEEFDESAQDGGNGESYKSEGGRLVKVDNGDILYQSIVGLVAQDSTLEEVATSTLLGMIYISDVDSVKKRMTVLTPSPGRLPAKTGLLTSVKWQDV